MGDAAAQAQALGQALQNVALNASLSNLPTYSDDFKEDKMTAKEWMERFMSSREGGGWTDQQSVTYFRNALKGQMIPWFNGLKIVRNNVAMTWEYLKEKFERDFRAAPSVSKVISQLPEIKQMDSENVNHYFNRCILILASLKERIENDDAPQAVEVSAATAAAFAALTEVQRTEYNREVRKMHENRIFNRWAGFYIISGFKASIRSNLMDRDAQLTTLDLIKEEALKIEIRQEEKKKTSTNGDGSTRVLTNNVNMISTQNMTADEVDAINNRWKNNGSGTKMSRPKCSHCQKPGHLETKCWEKHPNLRPKRDGNKSTAPSTSTSSSQSNGKKKCGYCAMGNHPTEKCYKLDKDEKAIQEARRSRSNVNKVDQCNSDNEDCNSKN